MGLGYSPGWRRFSIIVLRPLLFALFKRDWRRQFRIPRQGGVIVAANHVSWADPFTFAHFIFESGRYPVFLAKSTIFTIPVLGHLLRRFGQIPVYRDTTDAALALRDAEAALRGGECVVIYPEGTCTRDPALWPMTGQTGAARLALATGVPVVPAAQWGAQWVWPYGTKRLRPFPRKRIHVLAGPPVDLSAYAGREPTAELLRSATDDIMRRIAEQLGELRGERPPERLYDHRQAIAERRARRHRGTPPT